VWQAPRQIGKAFVFVASAFTIFGSLNPIGYAKNQITRSLVLVLWIRLKSVAGAEYARLNTGGSIIRGNSGNGALPTLNGENVGNKDIVPNDRAPAGN
jgi:hypothetical protein